MFGRNKEPVHTYRDDVARLDNTVKGLNKRITLLENKEMFSKNPPEVIILKPSYDDPFMPFNVKPITLYTKDLEKLPDNIFHYSREYTIENKHAIVETIPERITRS